MYFYTIHYLSFFLLSLSSSFLILPRVHKNIIIIRDLLETHQRPTCPIRNPSETHQRPTCLIGNPSETDMPDWRPNILHPRLICLIGDPSKTKMPQLRPSCLWRPNRDQYAPLETDMPAESNQNSNKFN